MDEKQTAQQKADSEAIDQMIDTLNRGAGILTGGEIHPDIPTIHDVNHREGARLKTPEEPRHAGFGLFYADFPPQDGMQQRISFDAGGAMRNHGGSFSWTPFRGPIELAGYDMQAAVDAMADLALKVEKGPIREGW